MRSVTENIRPLSDYRTGFLVGEMYVPSNPEWDLVWNYNDRVYVNGCVECLEEEKKFCDHAKSYIRGNWHLSDVREALEKGFEVKKIIRILHFFKT